MAEVDNPLIALVLVWVSSQLLQHCPNRHPEYLPAVRERLGKSRRHQLRRCSLEKVKQQRIARQPHLDRLRDARRDKSGIQTAKKARIDQHLFRGMKTANEALLSAEIHRSLEPDAGVDLTDQGGRNAQVPNAAANQ